MPVFGGNEWISLKNGVFSPHFVVILFQVFVELALVGFVKAEQPMNVRSMRIAGVFKSYRWIATKEAIKRRLDGFPIKFPTIFEVKNSVPIERNAA